MFLKDVDNYQPFPIDFSELNESGQPIWFEEKVMDKREAIIHDAEQDYGLRLDTEFDAGVNGLCDGDTCRHSECDCWDNFKLAVEAQLQKQKEDAAIVAAF